MQVELDNGQLNILAIALKNYQDIWEEEGPYVRRYGYARAAEIQRLRTHLREARRRARRAARRRHSPASGPEPHHTADKANPQPDATEAPTERPTRP